MTLTTAARESDGHSIGLKRFFPFDRRQYVLAAQRLEAGVKVFPAQTVDGFISPLLVIPRSLEGLLAPAELDSILVHELVHLERRDPLWGAARTLFLAVFWHNPVVWLLCRSIALETEKSCDEEVIRLTGAPEAYADGILKTVRHSLGLPDPSLTGAAGHSVSSRIESILSPQSRTESPAMKMLVLSSACLIAVLTGYADPSSEAPGSPKSEAPAGNVYDIRSST